QECAPWLDAEWENALAQVEGEDSAAGAFDPDEGWRARALIEERKLAGLDATGDAAPREAADEQTQEELYAGAGSGAGDRGATGRDPGGAGGAHERGPGCAHAGDVAQPLPDDPAPGHGGTRGFDHAEDGRAPREAEGARPAGGAARTAQAGECASAGAGGHHRSAVASGERVAAGTPAPG